jgi:hypothetical protein
MLEEIEVQCPTCWQRFALEVDTSGGDADYVEDCPLCCAPMQVSLRLDLETGAASVTVEAA